MLYYDPAGPSWGHVHTLIRSEIVDREVIGLKSAFR